MTAPISLDDVYADDRLQVEVSRQWIDTHAEAS
jgi:hypothetical protein